MCSGSCSICLIYGRIKREDADMFRCPHCGHYILDIGPDAFVICPYCEEDVEVPEND